MGTTRVIAARASMGDDMCFLPRRWGRGVRRHLVLVSGAAGALLFACLFLLARSPRLGPPARPTQAGAFARPFSRPITTTRTSAWLPPNTSPPGRHSVFYDPAIPDAPPAPAVKLFVDRDGLYVVRGEDLARVPGWQPDADPRTFHLIRRGQSIPILVEGEADGRFDPGDRLLFYGEKRRGSHMFTKYSDVEVYWLTWGGAGGPRVSTRDAPPIEGRPTITTAVHSARFEQDVYWFTHHGLNFPTRNTWWWIRAQPRAEPLTYTLLVTVTTPLPNSPATVSFDVAPRTRAGTHHVRLGIGDHELADMAFAAHTYTVFTATVPPGLLADGAVPFTFAVGPNVTLGTEDLFLNGLSLTYTRTLTAVDGRLDETVSLPEESNVRVNGLTGQEIHVWDLDDGGARAISLRGSMEGDGLVLGLTAGDHHLVVATEEGLLRPRITGYTPVDYRHVNEGADEIIIAHQAVWEAAQRLAAYRRGQGYRVAVVDVDTLYDEFGWGWYHPEAIRAFLAYAYRYWPRPAPRYVLLFGDGHWNFKGLNPERYSPITANLVPPYLAWVDPYQGEVPVDIAYGMVEGNDPIPEMIVGRIPVGNAREAQAVVDKIVAYEQGDWWGVPAARRLLFVADNPDVAGDFPALAEELVQAHAPPWAEVRRIYLGEMYASAETARQIMLSLVNEGVFLLVFQGHGAVNRWTNEGVWRAEYVADLDNRTVWPVVVTFNCLDGYYAYPGYKGKPYEAIAELMLRREATGSIAAWSPAGLGTPYTQQTLAHAFLTELFSGNHAHLGDAVHAARLAFYRQAGDSEIFFTQTLFGDPLLRLILPSAGYFPSLAKENEGK